MKASRWIPLMAVIAVLTWGTIAILAGEGKNKGEGKAKDEKTVTIDQVPAAVKAAILKEAGDNKIKEIEEKTKGGKTIYEAEWIADGKEVELKLSADGAVLKKKVEAADKDDQQGDNDDEEDDD
jgi:hypothetical protein